MAIKIVDILAGRKSPILEKFLSRPAFDPEAEKVASKALGEIRAGGNKAVVKCVALFEGKRITPGQFRVKASEVRMAADMVKPGHREAVLEARKRIEAFALAGMRKDWSMKTSRGGRLGEMFLPLDRVGVYIPGGAAPLASTALMTVTFAKTAGVREIVACTPAGRDGKVNPVLLYALSVAGATEIYRVGGIQAIGMMAYGTQTVRKVQKIVGPGGPFVTAAKRGVYGQVALDLVAGPSEIAVLADDSANPSHVAADLLSQAEHGTGAEKALAVTTSRKMALAIRSELERQAATLSRAKIIRSVLDRGVLIVVARDVAVGMEVCNRFAAEHLELIVRDPEHWLKKVRCAGAVFLGPWSPEPAGDFAAGPSHVLPTGGTAAMFSGLMVDDFRRRSSFISFTKADLWEALPVIEAFGEIEGLDAHARSARIRFED